jgi:tungstate transport system ATP-binding protein
MAMVFQKPVMFKTSVRENVSYGLKIIGEGKIDERVEAAIEAVGLSGYESRDANTLSGGEMQRIALARALVLDPELLLLDEPTANLDPKTAASIDALISRFEGTVIMATHNMLQARRMADRVAVLIEGRLAEVGRPKGCRQDGSLIFGDFILCLSTTPTGVSFNRCLYLPRPVLIER